jgi:hypothetical protein
LSEIAPDVPEPVRAACEQAMDKDPAARPTAQQLSQMLEAPASTAHAADGAPPAPSAAGPTSLPVEGGPRRRRGAMIAGLLAIVVAVLFGAIYGITALGSPSPERPAGVPVTVPRLKGMTVAEAEDALLQVGLEVADVRDAQGREGIVTRTEPAEGARVQRGAGVTLFVGTGGGDQGGGPPGEGSNEGPGDGEGGGGNEGSGGGGDDGGGGDQTCLPLVSCLPPEP